MVNFLISSILSFLVGHYTRCFLSISSWFCGSCYVALVLALFLTCLTRRYGWNRSGFAASTIKVTWRVICSFLLSDGVACVFPLQHFFSILSAEMTVACEAGSREIWQVPWWAEAAQGSWCHPTSLASNPVLAALQLPQTGAGNWDCGCGIGLRPWTFGTSPCFIFCLH